MRPTSRDSDWCQFLRAGEVVIAKRRQDYTDASIFGSPNSSQLAEVNVTVSDRIWFYDASARQWKLLTIGAGLAITGTTLDSTGAPSDAEYIVAASSGSLSAERVATDTATVTWDFATAGQAKANVVGGVGSGSYLATTVTYNNTAAMADTALSVNVTTGVNYAIDLNLWSNSAVRALTLDFGGTSTQSAFKGQWMAFTRTTPSTLYSSQTTAAGTNFTNAGLDGDVSYWRFRGTMVVNGTGTFLLRGAQRTADASNTDIDAGTSLTVTPLT